jgi:CTP:molybdopterin cytidylyltransferase MocA
VTGPNADRILVILAAGKAKRYGGLKPLAPVGPDGEAILDMVASDARLAGFNRIVLVLSPETGREIREHVEAAWPGAIDVRYALQDSARGTVDAVLAAWGELDGVDAFGVANADDLYGPQAFAILHRHLATGGANALVGFRLERAVVGNSPVTRGVCRTGPDDELTQIDERRAVVRRQDGTFEAGDGREPTVLDAESLVSMNLWALSTQLEVHLRKAMKDADEGEVLLPELVGHLVAAPGSGQSFEVLRTDGRCVGVTHPGDLELVQQNVRSQIERGERPAQLWEAGAQDPSISQAERPNHP